MNKTKPLRIIIRNRKTISIFKWMLSELQKLNYKQYYFKSKYKIKK